MCFSYNVRASSMGQGGVLNAVDPGGSIASCHVYSLSKVSKVSKGSNLSQGSKGSKGRVQKIPHDTCTDSFPVLIW